MTRVIFNLFKVSLFAFNTFYFLLGLALVIGSTFIYMNPNQLNSLAKLEYGREYANLVYTLNGVGIFFILVGFVGCLGILGDKSWLVFIYFCSLFAIFSLQFTCSVYIYLQSAHSFKALSTRILRVIREEYGESGVHARALDYLQAEFKCCGWYSPRDWFDSSYIDPKYTLRVQPTHIQNVITMSPAYLYKIPHSCCSNTYDLTCLLMNKFYEVGCERVVKYIYQTTELYIAWTLAFLNMFQLVILVLTLYVLCMMFYGNESSKEEPNRHYYIDENNISNKLEDAINREQRRRRRRASRRPTRCIRKLFCIGKSRRVNEQSESDEDVYEDDYHEFNDANRYRERDQIYMTSYYL